MQITKGVALFACKRQSLINDVLGDEYQLVIIARHFLLRAVL